MTRDEALGPSVRFSEVTAESGSKFLGAVFFYLMIALAITAGVSMGLSLVFRNLLDFGPGSDIYIGILIVGLVLYIPTVIWLQIAGFRGGKSLGPAFMLYSVIMGIMLSSITIVDAIPFWDIALSFGVTCLAFGAMGLLAWTSKKNLSSLGIIAFGLMMGALLMGLMNFIVSLFVGFVPLYWLVSFLILISIVLITIVDLQNVKRIAMSGNGNKNMALLCAFNLYVDFIYIFIRVLRVISRIRK